MADLSYTVRYFSTIISACLQFTSTTTIKIPPCGADWGKIPAHVFRNRGLCMRVAPVWRPGFVGTVLGSEVNGRPSGGLSLSPHSERALQAAITFLLLPPPLSIRCSVQTTGYVHHQSSESQKYTNTPWNDRRMWRKIRRRRRCCCAFGSLRSASSALFFHLTRIFSSNVLFFFKCPGYSNPSTNPQTTILSCGGPSRQQNA